MDPREFSNSRRNRWRTAAAGGKAALWGSVWPSGGGGAAGEVDRRGDGPPWSSGTGWAGHRAG